MIKLGIFNMDHFLQVVNSCHDAVNLIQPGNRKINLNKRYDLQADLQEQYEHNKAFLPVTLEIPNLKDYLKMVYFTIGDC